jgi:hypothetical protein
LSKDERLAGLEREHQALQIRMQALKEASVEKLEQRDDTIDSLRSALRNACSR